MIDSVCIQPASSSTQPDRSLLAVPADELAFALGVFVAAANGVLLPVGPGTTGWPEEQRGECEQLLGDLLASCKAVDPQKLLPSQTSLNRAFASLWYEYRAHDLRDAICGRVLSFHFLMEQTEGKVIEKWTTSSPDQPEEVQLHPAVVEALARVPLHREDGLTEANFLAAISESLQARYSA